MPSYEKKTVASEGTNPDVSIADCARTISAHNYLAHAPKLDAFSDQRQPMDITEQGE